MVREKWWRGAKLTSRLNEWSLAQVAIRTKTSLIVVGSKTCVEYERLVVRFNKFTFSYGILGRA